ncbi:MAG: glycosyltransferase, partial [Gammaproteobacteria bacterium]
MKVSVITVCRNAVESIAQTIRSVQSQDFPDVEHIIVDGASTDGTMDIINQYGFEAGCRIISEPDQGIYDAMNKGIGLASGDVIGFLNADDVYAHEGVLTRVATIMSERDLDLCFADLRFMQGERVVRHYSSSRFRPERLRFGWMPAHPTTYVRKEFFERIGGFSLNYKIAADYEWMVR